MFGWLKPMVAGVRKSRVTLFSRAPESGYAGIMGEAMAAFPEVSVGSYPTIEGDYRVRVVFRANGLAAARACADFFEGKLRSAGWEVLKRVVEEGTE